MKTQKEEHLDFLSKKGIFKMDCSHTLFSNEEIEILERYGHWFKALISGELEPYTEKQRLFRACLKSATIKNIYNTVI